MPSKNRELRKKSIARTPEVLHSIYTLSLDGRAERTFSISGEWKLADNLH